MTEREMFEKSFQRPSNFFKLPARQQWEIDKDLGILDWTGEGLSAADTERFNAHYKQKQRSKLLTVLTLALTLCACQQMPSEKPDPFPLGTRVFVQPDSTEGVVVESACGCGDDKYIVRYKDRNGTFHTVTVRTAELVKAEEEEAYE